MHIHKLWRGAQYNIFNLYRRVWFWFLTDVRLSWSKWRILFSLHILFNMLLFIYLLYDFWFLFEGCVPGCIEIRVWLLFYCQRGMSLIFHLNGIIFFSIFTKKVSNRFYIDKWKLHVFFIVFIEKNEVRGRLKLRSTI